MKSRDLIVDDDGVRVNYNGKGWGGGGSFP